MCHRVLNDETFESLRMCEGEPEANRAAVVLHIQTVMSEPDSLREVIDNSGDVVEGVGEDRRLGRVTVTESRVVWRDHMVAVRETGKERLEHPRRGWETVKQQDCRRVLRTGLSVRD
jgi:hypothetical protein